VGVEVVLDENDLLGLSKMAITQLFEDLCVIDGGASLGDLNLPPALERSEQHEQAGRAVALVLVVVTCRSPRPNE
jgi:hypothetical protein